MKDMHAHVLDLLPWYVNGTLAVDDRQAVEKHVGQCLPCRRALRDEETLRGVVRRLEVPSAESEGLDRLLARIDSNAPRSAAASRSARLPGGAPAGRAAWALAAGFGLLAVVGVWLALSPEADNTATGSFSTLSSDTSVEVPRIDVIFETGVTTGDITALLARIDATVEAGPSDIGRYTLILPEGMDADAAIRRLREDPLVRFASRTFIDGDTQ